MTDRAFLQDRAARYLHRTDFTVDDFNGAIAATAEELGRVLRTPENLQEVSFSPAGDPETLPGDYRAVLSVEVQGWGGWYPLESIGRHRVRDLPRVGEPAFYQISGRSLSLVPYASREVRVRYYAPPSELGVLPTSTNEVLAAYPLLYLYRVIAELALITQDVELVGQYMAQFDAAVASVNLAASNAQVGDAPAMMGV